MCLISPEIVPLLAMSPPATPQARRPSTPEVDQSLSADAKLTLSTLRHFVSLIRLSKPSLFPDVFLALCLPVVVAGYVFAGYYLILAPGTLYAALVAGDRAEFGRSMLRYSVLAVGVLGIKVARGALRESCSLLLRDRLTRALHALYVTDGDGVSPPPYFRLADGKAIDNPDQRVVGDVRDFAESVFQIAGGGAGGGDDSGGVIEACGSIFWYSLKTAERTGWIGIATAYGWSAIVAVVTVFIVNLTSPWVFRQEQLDAELRYGHVALRRQAEEVAFLRGGAAEKNALDSALARAISNGWGVVQRHVYLNFVQYGFAYFVSLVMYVAIGVSIFTNIMSSSSSSFSPDMSPGDKAKWISQTGGVFIQLLFSFTTVIQLGTATTAFVTNTTRVSQLANALLVYNRANRTLQCGIETEDAEGESLLGSSGYDATVVTSSSGEETDTLFAEDMVLSVDQDTLIGPVSFRVEAGQWALIDGQSGAGKTSVLRALRGLRNIEGGSFQIPNRRGSVLFSPQRPYIPAGCSLRELVIYPRAPVYSTEETQHVSDALRAVGWRQGSEVALLDSRIAQWSGQLSPGESQIISAARVIMQRPQFAILDEPTSALDAETERRVLTALKDAGISVLTAGHRESLRRHFDHVVTVEGGRESGANDSRRGDQGSG